MPPNWNPKTRSPTANSVTPCPTSATVPAKSLPSTFTRGRNRPNISRPAMALIAPGNAAARSRQSAVVTPAAPICTRISPLPGFGRAISATSMTSGPPYRLFTAAFIVISIGLHFR
jgi:hypothetical protein